MSELSLHKFTAQYLKLNAACVYFHPPNGEARSPRTAGKLKAMGVVPGVPDFCLVLDGGRAAFLELKARKGRQQDSQKAFQARAEAAGAFYEIARTSDEVIGILRGWNAVRGSRRVADVLHGAA